MSLLTNLVAYWTLDEASGIRLDSTANGYNLSENNSVISAAGIINSAAQFTAASSQWLTITSNTDLQVGSGDFTISLWAYVDQVGTMACLGAKRDTLEWEIRQESDGHAKFFFGSNAISVQANTFGPLSTSTWYHIVFWHDSTAGQIGISVNTVSDTASDSSSGAGLFNGNVWWATEAGANFYSGRLDEIGYWKRVLTSTERGQLYNSGSGLPYSSFGGGGGTSFSMTMSGGVILSGSAANPSFAASDTSSGSVILGGSAHAALAASKTGSGGLILGGSDAASFAAHLTGSGGVVLSGAAEGAGRILLVASPAFSAVGSSGGTTSAFDSTGANCLVVVVQWFSGSGGSPVISDSKGNTWIPLSSEMDGSNDNVQIFYVLNPTVGTGHTFTVSGTSIFADLWAGAFSGVGSLNQQSGSSSTGASIQPGGLTPSAAGSLLISGAVFRTTFAAVDSGFAVRSQDFSSGVFVGAASGYLIQSGGPTAVNPTFTFGSSTAAGAVMAVFSPAPSGLPSFAATLSMNGGLLTGGSSGANFAASKTGSGGLILGGSATVVSNSNFSVTMSGGAVLGGSAGDSWSTTWSMSGGLVTGGSSPGTLAASRTSSGGLTLGGSAHAAFAASDTMAGGVILGGAAVVVPPSGASITMSGGATLGGAAGLLWSATYGMSGGVETGGQATVVFVAITIAIPGGRFRRFSGLGRILKRFAGVSRIFRRETRMGQILVTSLPKDVNETVGYIFDFSGFDEARAGETLVSATVAPVSGLSIGTAAVIDADTNFVPANLGVQVTISGGTAGTTYEVQALGVFSGGSTRAVDGQLVVEAAT